MVLVDGLEFVVYMGSSGYTWLAVSGTLQIEFRYWCFHIAVVCVLEQMA